MAQEGPIRQIRAIEMDAERLPPCDRLWPILDGEKIVGRVSSATVSPDFGCGVGVGMVRMTHWDEGTALTVRTPDGDVNAVVREKFWL